MMEESLSPREGISCAHAYMKERERGTIRWKEVSSLQVQERQKKNKKRNVVKKLREGETEKREIERMKEEKYFLCPLDRKSAKE